MTQKAFEAFSTPEVAAFLEEKFVPVAVDRDARPELGKLYMAAAQEMNKGAGAWPIAVFASPDGTPFLSGTHFMDDARTQLTKVADAWAGNRAGLEKPAKELAERLRAHSSDLRLSPVPVALLGELVGGLEVMFDPQFAGPGQTPEYAPKFALPGLGLFVMELASDPRLESYRSALLNPLIAQADRMATGGLFDQVDGGFFRHTLDRAWLKPDLEKRLVDQWQLISFYARLQKMAPSPLYQRVIYGTRAFVREELADATGLYATGLGKATDGSTDAYYEVTPESVTRLAGKDADAMAFRTFLGFSAGADVPHIAVLARTPADVASELKLKPDKFMARWEKIRLELGNERATRTKPPKNGLLLSVPNGLYLAGLVDAALATSDATVRDDAVALAHAIERNLLQASGRVLRGLYEGKSIGAGTAEDYAALILGLTRAHVLAPKDGFLQKAQALAVVLRKEFWDAAGAGFVERSAGGPATFVPFKDFYDGDIPSTNGLVALSLAELALATQEAQSQTWAREAVEAYGLAVPNRPFSQSTLLRALLRIPPSPPAAAGPGVAPSAP